MKYVAKTFNIRRLDGISETTIEEHLKLYAGYVSNFNHIQELLINGGGQNLDSYSTKEAIRRQGFEYGGIKNHEFYFTSLEGGSCELDLESALNIKIADQFGDLEAWKQQFIKWTATMRGVGWAILGYDRTNDRLINYWVDEQHLGHLPTVYPIICLDMWEHSYCIDYVPSKKIDYIEAFFRNLNWSVIARDFDLI